MQNPTTQDAVLQGRDAGATVTRSEERLLAGTVREPVERVRIYRDVVVEEVTQVVQVRREVLRVEREPVSRGSAGAAPQEGLSGAAGAAQDRLVEIVLREERPVVGVEVVPVERVRLVVTSRQEVAQVSDEVRVERVELEASGSAAPARREGQHLR